MNILSAKNYIREHVWNAGVDWIDENIEDYDTWEDAYDYMIMEDSVIGNTSGRCSHHNSDVIDALIWDSDFIYYVEDADYNLGEIIRQGEEVAYVWAAVWTLDVLYSEFADYFDKQKGIDDV